MQRCMHEPIMLALHHACNVFCREQSKPTSSRNMARGTLRYCVHGTRVCRMRPLRRSARKAVSRANVPLAQACNARVGHICRHSLHPALPHEHAEQEHVHSNSENGTGLHNGQARYLSSHDADDGSIHSSPSQEPSWGPIRSTLYMLLAKSKLLQLSDFLSHTLRASLLSAACFMAAAFLSHQHAAAAALPSMADAHALTATLLLGLSFTLSGLPALVDGFVQVRPTNCNSVRLCEHWARCGTARDQCTTL